MRMNRLSAFLDDFMTIRNAVKQSEDGNRCIIAPHPDLKDKINEEIKKLQARSLETVLANKVIVGETQLPGLNDGLIYPGTMFPLGTGIEIARSAGLNRSPLRGTVRVVVVLVDFPDKAMTQTKRHFEDLFFSLGTVSTGSVREYYREVSHNLVDIQGEVVGPFRMPKKLSEYAHNASGIGGDEPNAQTMAKDAAVASNPSVNFVPYDNDGDGFVDAFIVIHAGTGAETTGSSNDIWSHKWVLKGGAYTADNTTKIYAYLTVPEDCRLGVCAHELGHLLFGFPDLYDTDYSSEGIGNWCLMGGGSWNNGGLTPAHPSAWCKSKQSWITIETPVSNIFNASIQDVKTGYKAYRLWKDGTPLKEYFLVENRQKTAFDKYLPGAGLLIWHVDEAMTSNKNEAHYCVALEQADGKLDLEHNSNRGDGGDCFPGSTHNVTFDLQSTPNSKSYAGSSTCVAVKNISEPASVMHADLYVKCIASTKISKDFWDHKRSSKDIEKRLKDKEKELKEKDFKELKDKEIKEYKEKDLKEFKEKDFKEGEKAIKDKDKEKDLIEHKVSDTGGDEWGLIPSELPLEQRVAYLEYLLSNLEPFIASQYRPPVGEQSQDQEKS